MLLTFSDKEEVDKILAAEPWSFDRHIVLLQRYDKKVPIRELVFKKVVIWIQIHDIPAPNMTREVAKDLCGNAGIVDKMIHLSKMVGWSFMRVQVVIDVSLPLCRGRLISFNKGEEGWVSFKYERLPNICYWCGFLNHRDKDCDQWIESDGSLKDEDKEYGPWIRTTAAALNKKSVVRVPGFNEARKKKQQPIGQRG
uniref:Zinc knuckle CX2CX4HX4C domain-containing protein n=1 Tax=Quercus lobata TaxID=97700 RepID=A0A7N2MLH9_QUELO